MLLFGFSLLRRALSGANQGHSRRGGSSRTGRPPRQPRLQFYRPVVKSLEEKVGQMTQPDQMFLESLDDIETYHLGSLLSGGDSDPKSGNDLQSWTDLYDRYQSRH